MPSLFTHQQITLPLIIAAFLSSSSLSFADDDQPWFERETQWHGFRQQHFHIADRPAYVVVPQQAAAGNPWVWRARFPGYHAEMDRELLAHGYHIGYVDVANLFGSPTAIEIGNQFYNFMTNKRNLATQPALEGVSRGGLFVYNWAAANPQKVACIYCDTPVCDIKSWPGGQGSGLGSKPTWQKCLTAYSMTEEAALRFEQNPIDHGTVIARANIPLLHIVSENDRVVPPQENSYLLQKRLRQQGHELEVISVPKGTEKSNGHHFDHPEPERVVTFIIQHTRSSDSSNVERMNLLQNAKRILFLGNSITYAGEYISWFDTWLSQELANPAVVINAGLPSETVSGLSEAGHAGGQFPRPDLAERLTRVLNATQPDLVFACYGINCGIYQPLSEQRFKRYQQGIEKLKHEVESFGAQLVLITPPCFDDQRAKKEYSYNEVLHKYSEWLVKQKDDDWIIIDLHGPMSHELLERRKSNPDFTFQPDAVHPNPEGHRFIAEKLIAWFGGALPDKSDTQIKKLVTQRLKLRRDAYLAGAGHKRPGISAGLPIAQAEQEAEKITKHIQDRSERIANPAK